MINFLTRSYDVVNNTYDDLNNTWLELYIPYENFPLSLNKTLTENRSTLREESYIYLINYNYSFYRNYYLEKHDF